MEAYSRDHLIIDGNSYILFCIMKRMRFWPVSTWDILSWLDTVLSQMNITVFFVTDLVIFAQILFKCEPHTSLSERVTGSGTNSKHLEDEKPTIEWISNEIRGHISSG